MEIDREDWKNDGGPDEFWTLIALGRRDFPAFEAALRNADRRQLIRFAWWFEDFASELREPGDLEIDGLPLSEDALDDLAGEIVAMGKAYYEEVCAHRDRLPGRLDRSERAHAIRYTAQDVFHERYGEEIPPYGDDY